MPWSKNKIIRQTNNTPSKSTLAIGHSMPLRSRVNKPLNLKVLANEVDLEGFRRETLNPPTHNQAEWE